MGDGTRWSKGLRIFLKIAGLLALGVFALLAVILGPRFWNMKSEYFTAGAIGDLRAYVRAHEGKWPTSPSDLGDEFPADGLVHIDYSVTADQLIANPDLLHQVVRPRSGKFYTYPRYEEDLEELLAAIKESRPAKTSPDSP